VQGTQLTVTFPPAMIAMILRRKPGFQLPDVMLPPGALLGFTAGGLLCALRMLGWGLHSASVLNGTMRGLASLMYSTERLKRDNTRDPALSHYLQREWRIVGGLVADEVSVTSAPSIELRQELVALDPWFNDEIELPIGRRLRVDGCEVLQHGPYDATPIIQRARRVLCPQAVVDNARTVLSRFPSVPVAASDNACGHCGKAPAADAES